MRYAVRITKHNPETGRNEVYIEERFSHTDRSITKEWLPTALKMDGVISAEVVPQYSDEERAEFFEGYRKCIQEYGERETVKLVEDLLSQMPVKAKVHKLEQHPAFQLLSRPRQQQIHHHYDWDNIRFLARQLLSSIAADLDMRPLSANASDNIWRKVIYEIKAVLYAPEMAEPELTRAEREARREHNRAERLAQQPAKGAGKGGGAKAGSGKR